MTQTTDPAPDPADEYEPVPVEAARDVATAYAKNVVVIVSWDRQFNRIHTTTYGRSPQEKQAAARLGDVLAKAAGCNVKEAVSFEDFRLRTQADWAQEKDGLQRRIAELEAIMKERREPNG